MSEPPAVAAVPAHHADNAWIICPWCNHEHGDGWELAPERREIRCDGCDNMFTCDPDYSVTYYTFVTGKEKP